ncbi:hypothetical protein [Actinocorallia lasiicapitis]
MNPAVDTFARLAAVIQATPPRCGPVRLVADPGGSGESTSADRLHRV